MLENEQTSNIETTIEEKEVAGTSVEEILLQDETVEVEEKTEVEENIIVKELLSGVIDQIAVSLMALATLVIFNLVLKLFGYYIAEKQPMFLIIYVIINIIYPVVCKRLKIKVKIGEKVLLNK